MKQRNITEIERNSLHEDIKDGDELKVVIRIENTQWHQSLFQRCDLNGC